MNVWVQMRHGENQDVARVVDHANEYLAAAPPGVTHTWAGLPYINIVWQAKMVSGMGKALFYRGEFYIMGGETLTGPGANGNNCYDRVDVYDPETNTWRLDAPMTTARHGIFPVLFESRMFLAGGGAFAGNSQSTLFQVFSRQ